MWQFQKKNNYSLNVTSDNKINLGNSRTDDNKNTGQKYMISTDSSMKSSNAERNLKRRISNLSGEDCENEQQNNNEHGIRPNNELHITTNKKHQQREVSSKLGESGNDGPKITGQSQSSPSSLPQYNFTKFCYRHNPENKISPTRNLCYHQDLKRFSDINKNISQLPNNQQSELHHMISYFANANDKTRKLILDGLLASSCFPQLSYVMSQVSSMIKIDFISTLPKEISCKILSYLDCESLCNAARVCRSWQHLADDDKVWYHMCEQHIDRKCPNCGWGLPLLHMKRARHYSDVEVKNLITSYNGLNDTKTSTEQQQQNQKEDGLSDKKKIAKPWKDVYRERYQVESNWRRGKYNLQEFKGHMDGVLTLQFKHRLLFTGSYDSTVAVWDLYTGKLIRRLVGSTDGVKTLHFDGQKLITGSLDKTIKVWNYVTGECISTYRGHTDSVMSVDSFKKIIVSGSADKTVKVWHVESRACYTLRGHTEWVNCVKLHPKSLSVFSCSDDTTIRMWDIRTNVCLKVFRGHVGQVQKVIPLTIIDVENLVVDPKITADDDNENNNENDMNNESNENTPLDKTLPYPTHLLSCSLDNTIKLWDVQTGKCIRTQFGHVEGVWDIAADNFRIISGSHDGFVKIWDLQCGKCMHTFQGTTPVSNNNNNTNENNASSNGQDNLNGNKAQASPIACVCIGDSEFFCGDETGTVKMYNFDI